MHKQAAAAAAAVVCLLLTAAAAVDEFDEWEAMTMAPAQPPVMDWSKYCVENCDRRCSNAGYRERCLQYCGICCDKCHCVPPGTFGNKDACPCYRDFKNSKGGPKCP
ncbi:peamaclein-like [Andrographis paniculata]|uniref:peamaclein-like n=1 Tax=Andrographis paniculata TaxID=175694 RepID=UPI0021E7F279|nr:peamaclein-like [Andrographis paniculata]